MSRNSENNAWPSAPVKSSYSSLGSNSGSSSMMMSTRPDPWNTSSSSREIETTVWQRPPQPPTDKYVIIVFLSILVIYNKILYLF